MECSNPVRSVHSLLRHTVLAVAHVAWDGASTIGDTVSGVQVSVAAAGEADAPAIASLRTATAEHLTLLYGPGRWSTPAKERGVLRDIKTSQVLLARDGADIVATLRFSSKKPWAIDLAYFHTVPKALYLHDMAVLPSMQRQGIGRRFLRKAIAIARTWPGDAIRLDAYDADAGAGGFYARCGFREVGRVTYRNTPLIYFELLL